MYILLVTWVQEEEMKFIKLPLLVVPVLAQLF